MITAIDTETTLATNAEPVPRLVSVALADDNGTRLYAAHEGTSWAPDVADAFWSGDVVFANAPFDIFVLLRADSDLLPAVLCSYQEGHTHDVLTREKLIDIAEGEHFQRGRYSLGEVAWRRAGYALDKDDPWRKRYAELLGVDIADWPAEARDYALHDARATLATFKKQQQHPHADLIFVDAPRQARGHLALYAQTLRGIRTDQARVEEIDARLLREITKAGLVCVDSGLGRIGGTKKEPRFQRNKKAAQAALEEHCKALKISVPLTAPTSRFPDGQVSLSDHTLKACRLPKDSPLDAYRRLGALQAARTKNIPILRRPIIRTRYDECVGSGRTSSSGPQGKRKPHEVGPDEWIGSNLQNQNRDGGFRECLVPPPGHLFVGSDWSGAELVTLAQVQLDLFGHSALADMLRAGRSPHDEFAAAMLGIRIEDFDKSIPAHKDARQGAKAWNFGKPGGMGMKRFLAHALDAYKVRLTPDEYYRHDETWHATFPEMREFFDYVSSLEGPDGTITVFQPRSGRVRGGLFFPDACNTHFQGLAADAAKEALWRLWLAGLDPDSPLYGGEPIVRADGKVSETGQVLFVHDENVTCVRAEAAEAARDEQERIMIEAFAVWCPDVPIGVESWIGERYTK